MRRHRPSSVAPPTRAGVPEGDVVWRTARRLHAALAGDVLTAADLRWPGIETADLSGREVLAVLPRGKHLLMRFSGDPPLTLHSHLRMEGSWRLQAASMPAPTGTGRRDDVRAVLRTATWTAVGRKLGMLDLVPHPGRAHARGAPGTGPARRGLGSRAGRPDAVRATGAGDR